MKYLLGYDIGSSSVKAALLEISTGKCVSTAYSPKEEMIIDAPQPGFAEQDPDIWWQEVMNATKELKNTVRFKADEIAAIGISYQMHGLVCIDKNGKVLRPAIIWCDSRAVAIGDLASEQLGAEFCNNHLLNSPGNFTASKLKWVKDNEPDIFQKTASILLPGDYIAFLMTGEKGTTVSGLSEAILWDFREGKIADPLVKNYGFDKSLLPAVFPQFGEQGKLTNKAAEQLDLRTGIPVTYRAGDQPNNAYSLNVLQPGEIAATAGTSGVVYGVTDTILPDPKSRVNTFLHVTHTADNPRYGILLCINGTGILNSWMRKNFFGSASYDEMNAEASKIEIGSDGLLCYPFGNGAERVLANKDPGASVVNMQFNRHHRGHMSRAIQEGIVFSLNYGISIMKEMGVKLQTVRAGHANMFLSEVFAGAFANTIGCKLELYNTDGASGAARAAGVGAGIYKEFESSFRGIHMIRSVQPEKKKMDVYQDAYQRWLKGLEVMLKTS